MRPHRQHSSSPSTILIHRQRASSEWTVNVGRRLQHPSSSVAVGIGKRHHHLSVGRLRGPRGSSSPTTDVEDGRQPPGSSTSTESRKTAINCEVHRHPWWTLKTGDALRLIDRWKIVVVSSEFLTSHVHPVGSGFNIFGIDRPRCN